MKSLNALKIIVLSTFIGVVFIGSLTFFVIGKVFSPSYSEYDRLYSPDRQSVIAFVAEGGGATVSSIVVLNAFQSTGFAETKNEIAQFYGSNENDVSAEWKSDTEILVFASCKRVVSSKPAIQINGESGNKVVKITYSIFEKR